MSEHKKSFLINEVVPKLRSLESMTHGRWGLMNAHQMVEHLIDAMRWANGNVIIKNILTPEEQLEKMQAFILSDKEFKENTKNKLMSETPSEIKINSMDEALNILQSEIENMYTYYEQNPNTRLRNPFFGDLNLELNEALIYKHIIHHCKQFGLDVTFQNI